MAFSKRFIIIVQFNHIKCNRSIDSHKLLQRSLKSTLSTFTETFALSLRPFLALRKCIYILIDDLEQLRKERQNYNKTEGKQQDSMFLVAIMPSDDDGKAKGHSTCFLLLDSCKEVHFLICNNNTYNNNNKIKK
uniref:Uncharacterized protein n=1 Tax=Glossina pallidipes TaxID=7398 RepID=A0A1B0A7H0_GLOPL